MAKVKVGISRLNSEGLIGKGQTIVEMMTLNPVYTELQAELPAISNAVTALIAANNEAQFVGGKVAHEQKRVCDATLRKLINDIAPQVQTASGGNVEKILGGGFDVVKTPEHGELPASPTNFKSVYTAYDNTVKLRWRGDKLSIYYNVERMDDKGEWMTAATTSRCTISIDSLTSGQAYTFRVLALGAKGASPVSDAVTAKAA